MMAAIMITISVQHLSGSAGRMEMRGSHREDEKMLVKKTGMWVRDGGEQTGEAKG